MGVPSSEPSELFDFSITEGRRSIDAQIAYLRRGVTRTIDSRRIPRGDDGAYRFSRRGLERWVATRKN